MLCSLFDIGAVDIATHVSRERKIHMYTHMVAQIAFAASDIGAVDMAAHVDRERYTHA